jgi:hypothetical protein
MACITSQGRYLLGMDHIADRIAYKARPVLIIVAALCLPAFLLTYGFMVVDALKTWPWWSSATMAVSHIVLIIGLAGLHDFQQERRQQ